MSKSNDDSVLEEIKTNVVPAEAVKPEGTTVYIGPEIPNVVRRNTFFNNGLTDVLQKKMEDYPLLGALVVPLEELNRAQNELEKAGSALAVIFDKAKEIK